MESDKLEFKREVNKSLIKEIIAFLNVDGGTIIVGYNDDGSVYGLKNVKEDLEHISNMIYDNIEPNISFLVSLKCQKHENKDVIVIEVLKGVDKPYYLKSKGLTTNGVFIRLASTSVMAPSNIIRQMLIESSYVSFEKNISIDQDLTFEYTKRKFKEKGLSFGEREMKNLGLLNDKNKFTNLALLLSDTSPYTIKMAIYPGNEKTEFLDTEEIKGSVLEIIDTALKYLSLNNKVSSKIKRFKRIDCYDYNPDVLREALINAVSHRDYVIDGSILVHIFKDRIEILSLGGLVNNLTIEDIKLGSSSSRNPKLINIFHHLGLVEAYGSGIPRIFSAYKDSEILPSIKVAPNTFLVQLPKYSTKEEFNKIIDYIDIKGGATREELESIVSLKKVATVNLLNEMINKDILVKVGKARDTIYKLK